MAEAAVKFLLENVKNMVKDQVDLISGAKAELEKLQKMLEKMEAALNDLAEKQVKGYMTLRLEKYIREAVYNAEDTIDTCLTQKSRNHKIFSSPSLAKKVKDLTEKELKPLYEEAVEAYKYNSQQGQDASAATRPGRSDHNILEKLSREGKVVGFADEEATLMNYLTQETEELDVISIVGMPGLGKTTLAWKIYCDEQTKKDFPTLIWVYVSQEFNVRDVFLTILTKFTQHDMSSKNDLELAGEVKSHLEKGRFLLFLDDVWTVEDWIQIEVALPQKFKFGKVLITSRLASVAIHANRKREPHQLRFLLLEESWELLQLEVFGSNSCPPEFEGLGRQIASQCGGVPLAVVVIGGILVMQGIDKKDLWEKVSDSLTAHYYKKDDQKRTENIILLSYNKLPHDLKDCFLYLGMFPEDTEISAWKLIRLWIAEGFINHNQNHGISSLEEVAEDNLKNLVDRNLVMVEKFKANGDVKSFRVHGMIREFCRNEAAVGYKNLFQEVKKTGEGVFDPPISEIGKCRRLCIHSHVMDFLQRRPKGPKVRSLLCFSKETVNLPPEYNSTIPDAFDLLRVIDASPIKFTRFPAKLTRLIHLRYVTLSSCNEFQALPKNASKLWNLQTVKIDTTAREFDIKADIGKMKQLRHLKTKAAIVLNEVQGDEGGENLQTLSRLSTKSCTNAVFSKAKNVRNLGIRGQLDTLKDANFMEKLEHLENLKLVHDTFPKNTSENPLNRLPLQHSFPPNLRILTLSSTFLAWTQMATLGSLCKLEVLKLKEMAFKGNPWVAKGTGNFLCLESLHISRTDLEIWTASGDPFPKLKNLILKNCEKLQEIPMLLSNTLQLVDIERVSPALVTSAKRMEKKIQEEAGAKKGGFKLIISPGDASAATSSTN